DVESAASRQTKRHDFLQNRVQTDRPPDQPPRSGKDQQVAYDFRGAIRFAIDRGDFLLDVLREDPRPPEELEMAENPLQRVVQLVGDSGDELSERGELLRLGQPFP